MGRRGKRKDNKGTGVVVMGGSGRASGKGELEAKMRREGERGGSG